jgi:hypothetical protein
MPKVSHPSAFRSKVKEATVVNKYDLSSQAYPKTLSSMKEEDTLLQASVPADDFGVHVSQSTAQGEEIKHPITIWQPEPIQQRFIDTIGLSTEQLKELESIQGAFFYLRIRTSLNSFSTSINRVAQFKKSNSADSKLTKKWMAGNSTTQRSPIRLQPEPTPSRRPLSTIVGSVYDLEVIDQCEVDRSNYFTISAAGVTLFKLGESQFTNLEQWNREFILFQRVAAIKFFRLYRRWKVCTSLSFRSKSNAYLLFII